MLEFTLRHTIDCNPARFWELFLDADWTQALFDDGLNFRCEVGPVEEVAGGVRRREMRVVPKVDLPGPVAKLFGDKLGYTERARLDTAKEVWSYELTLNMLADKIRLGGEMTLEPRGDERVTRVSKMWVEAKIFGIGGLVEKAAEKNMRDGWDKSAVWMNRWLAEHPAS
ncbi:MAG: DUF2505 domain-containing protein [Myxococcales bacterium]|nr:DUF2505 domain-containing protein [Myxococcales bacterium]MCB9717786.1 DUF2505 domain-containing protein [Myxococcales bacterium]